MEAGYRLFYKHWLPASEPRSHKKGGASRRKLRLVQDYMDLGD